MSQAGNGSGTALRAGLWIAQLIVGVSFVLIAWMKLATPIPTLATMVPWAGQYPHLVRVMGVIDGLGGIGIVLPALTRIRPQLTVAAAVGCTALQICAIVFHTLRGEIGVTPLNFVFLACSAFVWWGRSTRAPIAPRK